MKKLILIAGAVSLMALPAFAGMNPCDPGLPQNWSSSVYATYTVGDTGATTDCAGSNPARLSVVNPYMSAICVECHGRNPSDKIQAPSGGIQAETDLGSHYVATAAATTNTGGGFTGSFTGAVRTAGEYENEALWAPGGQATKGLSKYGADTIVTGDATVTSGDMICESCHNILVNRGDQLLLGGYRTDGTDDVSNGDTQFGDQLCVRCHGNGTNTYAAFHGNGNLDNWDSTQLKRHHVLSRGTGNEIDTRASGNYGTAGVMWTPGTYNRTVGPYVQPWAYSTTLGDPADVAFRDLVTVEGLGSRGGPLAGTDIQTGNGVIMCVSCHRPHNAETAAGAFIFRSGTGAAFTGTPATGTTRQSDYDTTFANKIYGDSQPLCEGCHYTGW